MKIESDIEFENVYLYVSDALRYDHVPTIFSDQNVIKTVSSSPLSCTAFATMVSGLYPPQHDVWNFSDVLSKEHTTLFDLVPGSCPFYMGLESIRSDRDDIDHFNDLCEFTERLESLSSPFLVVDRELCTHAPYSHDLSGGHVSEDERKYTSLDQYWNDRYDSPETIRREYTQGADLSARRFQERLSVLEERGLLEETLVIFTADHGEALGERGVYGHTVSNIPETVYVPTVFYNDGVTVDGEFMAHIDLLPTIAALLDVQVGMTGPGRNLLNEVSDDRLVFNAKRTNHYTEWGAWNASGGYAFSNTTMRDKTRRIAHMLLKDPKRRLNRRNPVAIARLMSRSQSRYGDPDFTREEGQQFCARVFDESNEGSSQQLDTAAKERLHALGYVDEEIE